MISLIPSRPINTTIVFLGIKGALDNIWNFSFSLKISKSEEIINFCLAYLKWG